MSVEIGDALIADKPCTFFSIELRMFIWGKKSNTVKYPSFKKLHFSKQLVLFLDVLKARQLEVSTDKLRNVITRISQHDKKHKNADKSEDDQLQDRKRLKRL